MCCIANLKSPPTVSVRREDDKRFRRQHYRLRSICLRSQTSELTDVVTVLDDKKARRIAHEMKLEVKGTLGLLLIAKQQGNLSELKPILASLDNAGFRLAAPRVSR